MADGSRSSSGAEARPSWVRWVMPSAGDLIFVAMLGVLALTPLAVRLLGDAGIGWHIRTGQWILATHRIPRVDMFSATMRGKPWFAWEWLYDLLVGGLERVAGLNAVVVFTAVVLASVFAWTFRLLVRRGTNVVVAVVLVLLAASASMIHFLARPHVISWLLTLAWFWVLDWTEKECFAEERGKSGKLLWMLPLLTVVWVNVHGGWLIGFVLLAIYWVGAVSAWFGAGEDKLDEVLLRVRAAARARELGLMGVVSAIATLANPYGWRLHSHIYHYLSDRFLMDHIDEFQSPNFHGVAQRCFAVLMLLAFVALGFKARRVRLSEGLVVLFAVYSGLVASRSIPVSSLLLVMVSGPLLTEVFAKSGWRQRLGRRAAELRPSGQPLRLRSGQARGAVPTFFERMAAVELSLRGHGWAFVAIALSCWVAGHGGRLGSKALMDAHFDGTRFPIGAVSFIDRSGSAEPVLSPDYWGGYLTYRLHPKVLVVADDRHDLYGEEYFKSYLKMIHLEPGWDGFLREEHVHRVLMPKGSALANILTETPGWQMVYKDEVAVLFEAK